MSHQSISRCSPAAFPAVRGRCGERRAARGFEDARNRRNAAWTLAKLALTITARQGETHLVRTETTLLQLPRHALPLASRGRRLRAETALLPSARQLLPVARTRVHCGLGQLAGDASLCEIAQDPQGSMAFVAVRAHESLGKARVAQQALGEQALELGLNRRFLADADLGGLSQITSSATIS